MAKERMKLKGPRVKRTLRMRYLFILLVVYLSFSYTYYNILKNSKVVSNEEFIKILLSQGNANILYDYKPNEIVNSTMNFLLNIDFTKPTSLFNTGIFKYGDMEVKRVNDDEDYDYEELEKISKYIEDPYDVDIDNPIVYIYNTHQLENYSSDNLEIYGITPNVLMASYILKEKLNEKGISTIVEQTNINDFLTVNGWDYTRSYDTTRVLATEKKNKYSSLKYFIDLHRDSVSKEVSTIKIGEKNYAKVLFVVGLEHNNYQANLDNMSRLNGIIEEKYPGLSRGILKKSGPNVNGVYNQDISENSILIEVGAVDNTIEEVFNTIDVLAEVLSIYIEG